MVFIVWCTNHPMIKKIFIILFLINFLNITSVFAERWTLVGKNERGSVSIYIDKHTIKRSGNSVVWWQLDSYKNRMPTNVYTIYSNISKTEADCFRFARKDLYIDYFDQQMGEGNKVMVEKIHSAQWIYDQPNTLYYKVLEYVCNE